MTDDDQEFPSVTIPMKFDGTLGIGTDFGVVVKFKIDAEHGLGALEDLKKLDRGILDATFVSRQATLNGDSVDREWANMSLHPEEEPKELEYEEHCLGSQCPVFTVHTSGDLEGKYVCENAAEVEAYVEVVHGETICPRYANSEPEEEVEAVDGEAVDDQAADDPEPEALSFDPAPQAGQTAVVVPDFADDDQPDGEPQPETVEAVASPPEEAPACFVHYPNEGGVWNTAIGDRTRYGEFIADYIAFVKKDDPKAQLDPKLFIVQDDEGGERKPRAVVKPEDYGAHLYVESLE